MNWIIEFSGYVLLATILFGAVLSFFLIRGIVYKPRPVAPRPTRKQFPNQAAAAARGALEQAGSRLGKSSGAARNGLAHEVRRLESRLEKLLEQQYGQQREYEYAARKRETAWQRWKDLYDRVAYRGRRLEPEMRELLGDAEREFRLLDREVEEEWHRVIAHDLVNLEELKGQEVLTQAPEPTQAETAAAVSEATAAGAAGEIPVEDAPGGADGSAAVFPPAHRPDENPAPPDEPGGRNSGGGGVAGLRQADFGDPSLPKRGLPYLDPAFDLSRLEGGLLRGADLSGTDFSGILWQGLHLHRDGLFAGANLAGIRLPSQEKPHQFVGCDFSGVNFSAGQINHAVFSGCDLSRTRWGGAQLERIKFVACTMEEVAWEGVDLSRTVMSPEMIASVDFAAAGAPPRNAPGEADPAAAGEGDAPTPSPAAAEEIGPVAPAGELPPASPTNPAEGEASPAQGDAGGNAAADEEEKTPGSV